MIQLIDTYNREHFILNKHTLYNLIMKKYNGLVSIMGHSNYISNRAYQQLHTYSNILFAIKYTDAKSIRVNDFICSLISSTLNA